MTLKYEDLYDVLYNEPEANQYFRKLPDYVRDHIKSRAKHVNSFASLKDYTENLIRGDE